MSDPDLFLFVSHVSEDRPSVLEIVDELERRGISCWIAPRDVHPGKSFDDEIVEAIEACRAMLLVFSEHCNEHEYIRREITVAGESHKLIIPFRIENAQPRRGLRVRLSDLHWIDGFVSRERAIDQVVRTIDPDWARRQEEERRRVEERQRADEQRRIQEEGPGAASAGSGGAAASANEEQRRRQELGEEAVTAWRAALQETTRERAPLDWATMQYNLGKKLSILGEGESGTARLEEAVTHFRAALQETTREREPLDWAATQHELGNTLKTLGSRESGTARLEQAAAAYDEALKEYTRERMPLDWAHSQLGLANTLAALAERQKSAKTMEQALTCVSAAAEVYEQSNNTYWLLIANARITKMKVELLKLQRQ